MSRLLCCLRARRPDMGAALSHPQEGDACDGAVVAPPTMADVIRERKKKAGGAGLGTLRRRIANAARRPRDNRPDRGCEHARFIRSVVSSWRLAEVFLLCEELEAGAALRDLATRADLAREPAPALADQLPRARTQRLWCDVEICGGGGVAGSWSVCAHRCILAARSAYFRDLLHRYPPSCVRVPLEGACAGMTRAECEACIAALYSGTEPRTRAPAHAHPHHHPAASKYDTENTEAELDVISGENSNSARGGCTCGEGVSPRLVHALGITRDPLHTSMHYLLDSGDMADTRLVFRLEGGCGAAYGFRTALELPCHRAVLGARSRLLRSVMSRRGPGSGAVCVDEKVLPRRYARALLHAAYTDQVDLSLIGRNTSSPPSTNSGSTSAWGAVGRGASRPATLAMLEDAFQLYEIARFLEVWIVVQGCEDAVAEALSPETLPHVLRWAAQPHASAWLHRQAMRYLRDEFPTIMSHAAGALIPRAALTQALASDQLQASEGQALRALLRWSADRPHLREPNVSCGTLGGGSRRGARRRSGSDAALRETLAALAPLVRTEHLPHDTDLLHQLVRRGIVPTPPPPPAEDGSSAHAWLGRGSYRPARCFLPYLDEIKALLEDQAVPEAELARARRARYLHRIPDTLYMVTAARDPAAACPSPGGGAGGAACAAACLSERTRGALRARLRELRAAPPAHAALTHAHHAPHTLRQLALRAVRERGLPDACADALLQDDGANDDSEQNASEWECSGARAQDGARPGEGEEPASAPPSWARDECCRTLNGGGSARCASAGSLRTAPALHMPLDVARSGTCVRRDQSARTDNTHHRGSSGEWGAAGRALSAAVPDVAMAPNANTHLLTHRDYYRHPPPPEYGGIVLQLDLGDGATHTPRPGSRAQRHSAAALGAAGRRDHVPAMSCLRARSDEDELRAAIELSVMRAYSSFHGRGSPSPSPRPSPCPSPGPVPHAARRAPATLPQRRKEPHPGVSGGGATSRHAELPPQPSAPPHQPLPAAGRAGASPSPRRRPEYSLYRPLHDYRLDPQYGEGSASSSRGHSPNNYA